MKLYFYNGDVMHCAFVSDNLFADSLSKKVVLTSAVVANPESLDGEIDVYDDAKTALLSVADAKAEALNTAEVETAVSLLQNNGFAFDAFVASRVRNVYAPSAVLDKDSSVSWTVSVRRKYTETNFFADAFPVCAVRRDALSLFASLQSIVVGTVGAMSGKAFEKLLRDFYNGHDGYTVNGRRIHALKASFRLMHTMKADKDTGKLREVYAYGRGKKRDKVPERVQAFFCSVLFANDALLNTMLPPAEKKPEQKKPEQKKPEQKKPEQKKPEQKKPEQKPDKKTA